MTKQMLFYFSGGILLLIILQIILLPLNYSSDEMRERTEYIYDRIVNSETIRNEFLCHGIGNYQVTMNTTRFRHHFYFTVTRPLSNKEKMSLRNRIIAHLPLLSDKKTA